MRIGITGGNGFIGGHVVDVCREAGHDVMVFDALGKRGHRDDVEVMLGDIRDQVAMTELAAHVDGIIHLAAVLGTQETIQNPRPAAETNVLGGLNFLEAVSQYGLPGVYICVGNHWMNNTYSISKTTVERFVRMFNKERGTRVNNVRAVNAYGPRQSAAPPFASGKVRKITPAFVCRALSGMPVEVYGDGLQISDMVYVRDLAKTLLLGLEHARDGKVHDFVIEAGPIKSHTVKSVAEAVIAECVGRGYAPVEIVQLPMRPGEEAGAVVTADTTSLAKVGIDPTRFVSLEEGMKKTVDYFESMRGVTWNTPHELAA